MSQRPRGRHPGKGTLVRRRAFSIACTVLWAIAVSQTALAQYRSTQWTVDSGLPENRVRGVVLASDGYIWIAIRFAS